MRFGSALPTVLLARVLTALLRSLLVVDRALGLLARLARLAVLLPALLTGERLTALLAPLALGGLRLLTAGLAWLAELAVLAAFLTAELRWATTLRFAALLTTLPALLTADLLRRLAALLAVLVALIIRSLMALLWPGAGLLGMLLATVLGRLLAGLLVILFGLTVAAPLLSTLVAFELAGAGVSLLLLGGLLSAVRLAVLGLFSASLPALLLLVLVVVVHRYGGVWVSVSKPRTGSDGPSLVPERGQKRFCLQLTGIQTSPVDARSMPTPYTDPPSQSTRIPA